MYFISILFPHPAASWPALFSLLPNQHPTRGERPDLRPGSGQGCLGIPFAQILKATDSPTQQRAGCWSPLKAWKEHLSFVLLSDSPAWRKITSLMTLHFMCPQTPIWILLWRYLWDVTNISISRCWVKQTTLIMWVGLIQTVNSLKRKKLGPLARGNSVSKLQTHAAAPSLPWVSSLLAALQILSLPVSTTVWASPLKWNVLRLCLSVCLFLCLHLFLYICLPPYISSHTHTHHLPIGSVSWKNPN